jgi:hypothetical protein
MGQERLVVRLEHDPVSLLVDGLLDEEEKSADVGVRGLCAPGPNAAHYGRTDPPQNRPDLTSA